MTELTLQVEASERAPWLSRSRLAEISSELGPYYHDVMLVVSELVTNSVRHSGTTGIEVTVRAEHDHIRVEVSDDGRGFDVDVPRGDGMGLALVERIADRWGVGLGGRFTVWAEITRSPGEG